MTSNPYLPHDKLLDLLLDVVCVVDIEGRFLSVSAASERVFGYRPEEMIGRTAFELMHPDDRAATRTLVKQINSGQPSHDHENRYIHKDGHIVHIMWSAQWLEAEQVRVGVARDITRRKRAEAVQAALYAVSEAAHAAGDLHMLYGRVHEVMAQLLPARHFCVALYDAASDQLSLTYQAEQCATPTATSRFCAEVIRTGDALLLTPDTASHWLAQHEPEAAAPALDWLGVPLISGTQTIGALVLQNHSAKVRYSEQDQELLQFVSNQVATAIERKRTQSRLEFLAQYDQLTELSNRTLFLDRLRSALQRAKRDALQLAVLYLDMDNFKQINDSFGHGTGDLLLQEVARRLRQCVRESDTVGRLGGDEFAVILDNIGRQEDASLVAEKIITALSAPYLLDGHHLLSAPSLGIALYPQHCQSELQLVQYADEAMYVAKRSGGKRYVLAQQPLTDAG
ncbi:diguanylate cyclase domain-containing protein [Pseudomonas sp. GLN_6]|uniref:sensor domain-containing protein n=1 Tax=Pseudomonas sp. GLN_6 TaxID=3367183 RepID=UPI003709ED6C